MANKYLSQTEIAFMKVMETVEIMSVYEANAILQRYLGCSKDQVIKLLHHLISMYYIEYFQDEKYIRLGNRRDDSAKSVNGKSASSIVGLFIILDQLYKDGSTIEDLLSIIKDPVTGVISFLSKNKMYSIYTIPYKTIYKVNMVAKEYEIKQKRMNNDKFVKDFNYDVIPVFVFSETSKEDEILEYMGNQDYSFLHRIVILKSNANLAGQISYNMYEAGGEQE